MSVDITGVGGCPVELVIAKGEQAFSRKTKARAAKYKVFVLMVDPFKNKDIRVELRFDLSNNAVFHKNVP
jgi:hypothetical protein